MSVTYLFLIKEKKKKKKRKIKRNIKLRKIDKRKEKC